MKPFQNRNAHCLFVFLALLTGACSSPELVPDHRPGRDRMAKPQFRVEAVEVHGVGLEAKQAKKAVRIHQTMFRWCYESFL